MELAAIQISFVGIGVPACQREFRMTAYLSAVSSVTSRSFTRGEARNVFSSSSFLRRRRRFYESGPQLAKDNRVYENLISFL